MKRNLSRIGYVMIAALGFMVIIAGCSKEQSLQPRQQANFSADSDAAETIAGALGEYNGGAMDQLGDLCVLAAPSGLQGLGKSISAAESGFKERTYDPATGAWNIVVSRERQSENGECYAKIERTYQVQLLNKYGQPQQYWLVDEDTAYTVKFDLLAASGEHHTPRLSQTLKELQANFIATGVNTEIITINGSYFRAATNTITTEKGVRTHDYTLDLTFIDVQGPRGSRMDLAQKISGTVTGAYNASITFTGGDAYRERTVEREINIELGSGTAEIHIGGGRYHGDLYWGQCRTQ